MLAAAAARDALPLCCQPWNLNLRSSPSIRSPAMPFRQTPGGCPCPRAASSRPPPRAAAPLKQEHADRTVSGPPIGPRLAARHARVREFLQARRDRWRQIAAHFTRQIETLQAEGRALPASTRACGRNCWRGRGRQSGPLGGGHVPPLPDGDGRHPRLKARNAELQRQLLEPQAVRALAAPRRRDSGGDWATQKRRLLAEWLPTTSTKQMGSGG